MLSKVRTFATMSWSVPSVSDAKCFKMNRVENLECSSIFCFQDIPPVDFDWSSSGLKNPLDCEYLKDFFILCDSFASVLFNFRPQKNVFCKRKENKNYLSWGGYRNFVPTKTTGIFHTQTLVTGFPQSEDFERKPENKRFKTRALCA